MRPTTFELRSHTCTYTEEYTHSCDLILRPPYAYSYEPGLIRSITSVTLTSDHYYYVDPFC
jgi:hypothetical protein